MLECVVNLSEGRRLEVVAALATSVATELLDVHSDPDHHRSVLTLVGESAPRVLTRHAVDVLDLRDHEGAHPRLGVVDVVPFVPLEGSSLTDAIAARDRFAAWAATELGIPVFCYGPERTLPEVRRGAWRTLAPDVGPSSPHPTAGAICAGARELLVAYNLWLVEPDVQRARAVAAAIRGPAVRALGLQVGDRVQVSTNLVEPLQVGPAEVWAAVSALAPLAGAELVGLVPARVLAGIPRSRWAELDLDAERTIEWRLAHRGRALDGDPR